MATELNSNFFLQGDAKRSGLYRDNIIEIDANTTNMLNGMVNKFVEQKENIYNKWQSNFTKILENVSDITGVFDKDLPEVQESAKNINRWIVANQDIFTSESIAKDPQRYQEYLNRLAQHNELIASSKANKALDKQYKTIMQEQNGDHDKIEVKNQYNDWLKLSTSKDRNEALFMPTLNLNKLISKENIAFALQSADKGISPEAQKATFVDENGKVIAQDNLSFLFRNNKYTSENLFYDNLNQQTNGEITNRFEKEKEKGYQGTFYDYAKNKFSYMLPTAKRIYSSSGETFLINEDKFTIQNNREEELNANTDKSIILQNNAGGIAEKAAEKEAKRDVNKYEQKKIIDRKYPDEVKDKGGANVNTLTPNEISSIYKNVEEKLGVDAKPEEIQKAVEKRIEEINKLSGNSSTKPTATIYKNGLVGGNEVVQNLYMAQHVLKGNGFISKNNIDPDKFNEWVKVYNTYSEQQKENYKRNVLELLGNELIGKGEKVTEEGYKNLIKNISGTNKDYGDIEG